MQEKQENKIIFAQEKIIPVLGSHTCFGMKLKRETERN